MSQTTPCSRCGFPNRPTAQFCAKCGVVLAGHAPTVSLRLQAGQVMRGQYTIVRSLGRGGMGAIYLANQTIANQQRHVVLKEMLEYYDPSDPQGAAKAQQRFEAEAATLASLNFAGIPQIFDYFSENGRHYIVMQFIQGHNLEEGLTREDDHGQLIRGQAYPVEQVWRWGIQVCKALEKLAAQDVVHMDIKPANLIVDNLEDVWLVDFGTAKVQWMTLPGGAVGLQKSSVYGTVGYAPPEQTLGKAETRSDVYALAATLYHLLTDDDPRAHPFQFPKLDQLPTGLAATLSKTLVQDVNQRLTAAQFRQALESRDQTGRQNIHYGVLILGAVLLLILGVWIADRTATDRAQTAATAQAQAAGTKQVQQIALATDQGQRTATAEMQATSIAAGAQTATAEVIAMEQVRVAKTAQAQTLAASAATATADKATVAAQITAIAEAQLTALAQAAIAEAQLTAVARAAKTEARTATAEARRTATTQAQQTARAKARATETAIAEVASQIPVFGPVGGSLRHHSDKLIEVNYAGVSLYNFVVQATFLNSYSTSTGSWDYGFLFRHTGSNQQFRLIIGSNKTWELQNNTGDPDGSYITGGQINTLNTNDNGSNQVTLNCYGNSGALYVNGEFIAELDLSARTISGDVAIATELFTENETDSAETQYESFTVWSIP